MKKLSKLWLPALMALALLFVIFQALAPIVMESYYGWRTNVVMDRLEAYSNIGNSSDTSFSMPSDRAQITFIYQDGWKRIWVVAKEGQDFPSVMFYKTSQEVHSGVKDWNSAASWINYDGSHNADRAFRKARREVLRSLNIMTKGFFWFLPF